ncbi:hypothetical protein LPJ53_001611 [Coemansia erecta]|uniref:Uncharacterized protein n=1 Tax=Coemansia erecta TaxID=147472 RepID=A0A9W8CRZ3_9FUNG|nr:hypothetical protein LPJ53_001611 [Coemansia erecta]
MPALSTAVAVAEQVYPDGLRSAASSQHSSSVTTINSFATSDSPLSSDNEIFFGPLTTVELRAMKREQAHRRSTQLLTLTPLEDEEHMSARRQLAAGKLQTLMRGWLARKEFRRAMSDLHMLRTMGSASVQRRRTVRGQQAGSSGKEAGAVDEMEPVVVTPVVRPWLRRRVSLCQNPKSNTLSAAHIMPRQRHHPPLPPLPPLPEYTQSSDSLGQYQQQQQRLRRADSINAPSGAAAAAASKSPPPMFRQASAPTMRQTYMSMEPTLPDDVIEHEDENALEEGEEDEEEEDTDEDMGIAASVTRMTESVVEPIHEDSEEDYENINIDAEENGEDDDEFLSINEPVESDPLPQQQQKQHQQAEDDEDVSMVDCSSSAPNADAVSFVSCTETFASSAYETVASEAETVMPEPQQPAPMDHALRLSLRLSADATSFANFRLSSVIPRDSPLLTTLSEITEDAGSADNSAAESSRNAQKSSPENTAAQVDPLEQEQEDNPVHMRLRSLRSRRLNREPAQRPAAAPAPDTAAAETSGRRFRATQTVSQKNEAAAAAGTSAKKKPIGKMGQIQLDRLTKLNTRRNATYMTCRIERYNITREGKRPPSPSLLMQQRAEERRGPIDHRSIYSDSDSDWDNNDEGDEPDDSLPNGELCLEELTADTRPLSPLLLSENENDEDEADSAMLLEDAGVASAADSGTQEIKRKSVELSAPLHPSTSAGGSAAASNAGSKKQCRRPKVQWGSRSILRAPYLVGHAPPEPRPVSSLRPILSNVDAAELPPAPEPSARPMSTRRTGPAHAALKIIRVSTIKYEDSSESEAEEEEEDGSSDKAASQGADGDDDEYIPKKSIRNSRKK